MQHKKIIVYTHVPESILKRLRKSSHRISYYGELQPPSGQDFMYDLRDATGLLGSGLRVNKQLLDHAPQLRIVSNISVGYNNLDIKELTKRNVMATNTPDVLTETTADTIFGLLIATARRLPELDLYVKNGNWRNKISEKQFGVDVHNKVIGVIGMGRIGSAVAQRAHNGFHMKVLYHNRSRHLDLETGLDATYCNLDELLAESDFVCLTAPLTSETKNLIGKKEFGLMKKDSVFINGSRGQLVNEQELFKALNNGEILAAGLDVYQQEPIELNNPLLQLSNVVTLPHIGSATLETRYEMANLAFKNVLTGVDGQKPPCLINPEVLQRGRFRV